jgi:hypothetical protein
MLRTSLSAFLAVALLIGSRSPARAEEPVCPAHSSPGATTVDPNGDRVVHCHCDSGYAIKGGVCALAPKIGSAEVTGRAYTLDEAGKRSVLGSEAATYLGAHLLTERHSRLRLTLVRGTIILGGDTDIVLDEYTFDPVGNTLKLVTHVAQGLVSFGAGSLARVRGAYQFIASKAGGGPSITVTVHIGTPEAPVAQFVGDVNPDGSGYVVLYKGSADVADPKNGRTLPLRPGQMILFDHNGAHPAKPIDPRVVRQP